MNIPFEENCGETVLRRGTRSSKLQAYDAKDMYIIDLIKII